MATHSAISESVTCGRCAGLPMRFGEGHLTAIRPHEWHLTRFGGTGM
jgi:hypothetical protein